MKQEQQIIGFDNSGAGDETFYSYNPVKQTNTGYRFYKFQSGTGKNRGCGRRFSRRLFFGFFRSTGFWFAILGPVAIGTMSKHQRS